MPENLSGVAVLLGLVMGGCWWGLRRRSPKTRGPGVCAWGGHSAPKVPAGHPADLHDARLQLPEVGLQHDGPAVAHEPRRELLGEAEVEDRREQASGGPPGHRNRRL